MLWCVKINFRSRRDCTWVRSVRTNYGPVHVRGRLNVTQGTHGARVTAIGRQVDWYGLLDFLHVSGVVVAGVRDVRQEGDVISASGDVPRVRTVGSRAAAVVRSAVAGVRSAVAGVWSAAAGVWSAVGVTVAAVRTVRRDDDDVRGAGVAAVGAEMHVGAARTDDGVRAGAVGAVRRSGRCRGVDARVRTVGGTAEKHGDVVAGIRRPGRDGAAVRGADRAAVVVQATVVMSFDVFLEARAVHELAAAHTAHVRPFAVASEAIAPFPSHAVAPGHGAHGLPWWWSAAAAADWPVRTWALEAGPRLSPPPLWRHAGSSTTSCHATVVFVGRSTIYFTIAYSLRLLIPRAGSLCEISSLNSDRERYDIMSIKEKN